MNQQPKKAQPLQNAEKWLYLIAGVLSVILVAGFLYGLTTLLSPNVLSSTADGAGFLMLFSIAILGLTWLLALIIAIFLKSNKAVKVFSILFVCLIILCLLAFVWIDLRAIDGIIRLDVDNSVTGAKV